MTRITTGPSSSLRDDSWGGVGIRTFGSKQTSVTSSSAKEWRTTRTLRGSLQYYAREIASRQIEGSEISRTMPKLRALLATGMSEYGDDTVWQGGRDRKQWLGAPRSELEFRALSFFRHQQPFSKKHPPPTHQICWGCDQQPPRQPPRLLQQQALL